MSAAATSDALILCARLAMAGIFVFAGVAKLLDLEGTRRMLDEFGVSRRLVPGAALSLPAVEIAAGALLVPSPTARVGALLALGLIAVFIVAVGRSLARGEQPDCNCFGAVHPQPISRLTVVRNVGLGAVAAALVAAGPGESLSSLDGGTVAVVAGALAAALLLGLTWFSWQLFRQNGRLLLRVRALEEMTGAPQAFTVPGPPDKIGGLKVGDLVPDVALATPDGSRRSVRELANAAEGPIALVFVSPGCTGCELLTDRLPGLRDELDGTLELVLVTNGHGPHVGAAVAKGLTVLVQEDREAIFAFAVGAVPAVVMVEAGRIASPAALGPDAAEKLLLQHGTIPGLNVIEMVGGTR